MDGWDARAVQFLLDTMDDGVVVVAEDATVTACNRACGRILGGDHRELAGRTVGDVLVPVDDVDPVSRALAGASVQNAAVRLRGHGGAEVHVRLDVAAAGPGFVIVLHDDTERVETQASLADVQARLRQLQSLGSVGMWQWVATTGEVQWSEQLYEIHGLDPLAFSGTLTGHLATIREDDRDRVRAAMHAALSDGAGFESEYVIVRPDGSERRVYASADPLGGEEGTIGLAGIVQDVTEDRRARQAIEQANQRLERLASVLAHDLREPLASVAGFAELLEESGLEGESALFAERIRVNVGRAVELLSDVVAEARHPAEPGASEVDLAGVAGWVVDTLRERIAATGAQVSVDDAMPRVAGHPGLLRQALLNLVGNALKYGGRDSRAPTVELSAWSDGDVVELRVDDDGPGIPAPERARVFDDGYRLARDVDSDVGGTGIGLATVRDIARRLDTDVTVGDSDLGGARFILRLPAISGDHGPVAPEGHVDD